MKAANPLLKKTIALLICIGYSAVIFSQKSTKKEESFYLLDKDLNGTTAMDKAKYFLHSLKENDSSWLFEKYNLYGPLISSEHYKDDKATILNGHAFYYNVNGTIDSSGIWKNNLQSGTWGTNNEKGQKTFEKTYENGILITVKDCIKAEELEKAKHIDSSKLIDKDEKESEFPGKAGGWRKYLEKNLKYPERAQSIQKEGQVTINFIVDKEGNILNPYIAHSVEYSLDQEALRMIIESPKWIPAFQFGQKVKSWKLQPITFKLK